MKFLEELEKILLDIGCEKFVYNFLTFEIVWLTGNVGVSEKAILLTMNRQINSKEGFTDSLNLYRIVNYLDILEFICNNTKEIILTAKQKKTEIKKEKEDREIMLKKINEIGLKKLEEYNV